MTGTISVLRITPAFDWREASIDGAAEAVGGLAVQVALQTRLTAEKGISQHVLTMAGPGTPRAMRISEEVTIQAVGCKRDRGVHRRNLAWLLAVVRTLASRRARPQVIHVHASGLIEPLLVAICARLLVRRPVVMTLHCSAIATYVVQSRRDAAVQVLTRAAERIAIRLSERVFVLTERAARRLGPHTEVMADWVETERFAADAEAGAQFAERFKLPPGHPIALFVGRISREKGWPALISLAEHLSDVGLHVVVCGDGSDAEALEAAIERAGLLGAFTLTGPIGREEVTAAMRCASVLVLPSAHEELGSALIEAMASGLPAVAYDVGGVSEAVVEGVTGLLVSPADESALERAVRNVLERPELAERARTEGPDLARSRFDAHLGASSLAAAYEGLADG